MVASVDAVTAELETDLVAIRVEVGELDRKTTMSFGPFKQQRSRARSFPRVEGIYTRVERGIP